MDLKTKLINLVDTENKNPLTDLQIVKIFEYDAGKCDEHAQGS